MSVCLSVCECACVRACVSVCVCVCLDVRKHIALVYVTAVISCLVCSVC